MSLLSLSFSLYTPFGNFVVSCIPPTYPNPDVTLSLICCVHHRFDDEVKDDTHVAFIPEMMEFPQGTWIETFLEG